MDAPSVPPFVALLCALDVRITAPIHTDVANNAIHP